MKAAVPTGAITERRARGNGLLHQSVASAARWYVNLDISDKRLVIGVIIKCRNAQDAGDKPCNK